MDIQNVQNLLKNSNNRLNIIHDDNIIGNLNETQICDLIVNYLDDDEKMAILHNVSFFEKHNLQISHIKKIVLSISDLNRDFLLYDTTLFAHDLHLKKSDIAEFIQSLDDNKSKFLLFELYNFSNFNLFDLIKNMDDSSKTNLLLQSTSIEKFDKINILISFSNIEALIDFFNNNHDFFVENNIFLYEVVSNLGEAYQQEFVSLIDTINLTPNEKKEIFVILKDTVKQTIDTNALPEEYKTALTLPTSTFILELLEKSYKTSELINKIDIDFNRNLEDYRGLDNLIILEPEKYNDEERAKSIELCGICPNLKVVNFIKDLTPVSTAEEYVKAEGWINEVLNLLKPEYSNAQKIAIIDSVIGEFISYSPDFDTEVFNHQDCRSIWKIICSCYGVCNGIAAVEKYLFDRIGIESKIVCSKNHAFLKLINIELSFSNGEIKKGNTIIDPTWNLAAHRFHGKPNLFCIDYETARLRDIDPDGTDSLCHQNGLALYDINLSLDDLSLRKLFQSVHLVDENGVFPLYHLATKSKQIHSKFSNDSLHDVCQQFILLSNYYPQFATCPDSSMRILEHVLLNSENLKFKKCIINRVYNKKDKNKTPVLYVYIDFDDFGKRFFYADYASEKSQFIQLGQDDFTSRFECYEEDLKKTNGLRPWEISETDKTKTDLSKGSGKVVVAGGEER